MAITESTTENLKINFYATQSQFTSQTDPADNELHLIPATSCIVTIYHNGSTWYRVWSDGIIEQGGLSAKLPSGGQITLTLPKAYSSTNYEIFLTTSVMGQTKQPCLSSQTKSSFTMDYLNMSVSSSGIFWCTIGK